MASDPNLNLMPGRKVTLIVDETTDTEIDFPARPCVDQGLINLLPGERILLEAEVQKGALVDLHRVESVARPGQTLELELKQNPQRKSPFMILKIQNPFAHPLVYEAGIQPLGQQRFSKTSTAPVAPGKLSFESWPQPLTRILLRNFRLLVPS